MIYEKEVIVVPIYTSVKIVHFNYTFHRFHPLEFEDGLKRVCFRPSITQQHVK
jgi:hypothetical protein